MYSLVFIPFNCEKVCANDFKILVHVGGEGGSHMNQKKKKEIILINKFTLKKHVLSQRTLC